MCQNVCNSVETVAGVTRAPDTKKHQENKAPITHLAHTLPFYSREQDKHPLLSSQNKGCPKGHNYQVPECVL